MALKDKIRQMVLDEPGRILAYGIGCLVLMISLIILSSISNVDNYYLRYKDGALEIWKGRFSPTGKERFIMMPGHPKPKYIKDSYSKEEVFPVICNFYIRKASTLLDVPGKPDFDGMKDYLNRALSYATTDALTETIHVRMNSVDVMVFIYKADVAASRRTTSGFKKSLDYLAKAASLDPGEAEKRMINQKIQFVQEALSALEEDK